MNSIDSHTSIVSRLKRHSCLLVLTSAMLLLMGIVGGSLVLRPDLMALSDNLATTHKAYLIVWRTLFYTALIATWKPILLCLNRKNGKKPPSINTDLIKHSRRKLIAGIALYELFIIQNLPGYCLQGVWSHFHGG